MEGAQYGIYALSHLVCLGNVLGPTRVFLFFFLYMYMNNYRRGRGRGRCCCCR